MSEQFLAPKSADGCVPKRPVDGPFDPLATYIYATLVNNGEPLWALADVQI